MTALQMIAICAPLVHPDTALSVMKEESKLNQFAIGVVDGWVKQPTDFNSAVLTAQQLETILSDLCKSTNITFHAME